jgi:hypothetical protein
MTFPAVPVPVKVELALGADLTADPGTWSLTDVTDLIYTRDKITITRGRPDESGTADAGTASATANNRGGEWSTRNPSSPYYGTLRKGTPIRYSIGDGDPFDRTTSNGWGGTWTIAGGGVASNYSTDGTKGSITLTSTAVSRYATTTGVPFAEVAPYAESILARIATSALATGGAQNGYLVARYVDVNNYYDVRLAFNTNQTITIGLEKNVAGVTTVLVAQTTVAGLTHVANDFYWVRLDVTGSTLRARAWADGGTEPGSWQVTATDTTFTAAGLVGVRALVPNTNTNVNPVVSFTDFGFAASRYTGFLSAIPPRWDVSGLDRTAPLEARGLLYRIKQSLSPERSALRRTILSADASSTPIAYWPLEDGAGTIAAASAINGVAPMVAFAGSLPIFAADAANPGSAPLPDFTDQGTLYASLPAASVASGWSIECVAVLAPNDIATPSSDAITWLSNGFLWELNLNAITDVVRVRIAASDGTATIPASFSVTPGPDDGFWHHYRVTAIQAGADVTVEIWRDGVSLGTGTRSTMTLAPIEKAYVSYGNTLGDGYRSMGHVAVYSTASSPDNSPAVTGYAAEVAHTRFLRLCAEAGINANCAATESQAMGAQGVKALLDLLRECEAADAGYLYEGTAWDLVFQSHTERENMAVRLALNYTTAGHVAPPLEPTDDDQYARNDVEVKREDGSFSRLTETSAAVELSTVNIGTRDESVTLPLATDGQTYDMAGFRLLHGTWPGYRYPTITLDLAAGPSLIVGVCVADLAFRLTIDNPPDDIGPDAVDVIVEGYTETIEPYGWMIAANSSPAGPWHVGVLASTSGDTADFLGHLDWDSCVTAEALDSTETGVDVTTSPLITTTADDFPFDILIGGERMTATACSGVSNPQTLTVTRSVNGVVKTHLTGVAVDMHPDDACYLGL